MSKLVYFIFFLISFTSFSQDNTIYRAISKNVSPSAEILESSDLISFDYAKKEITVASDKLQKFFFSKNIIEDGNQTFTCLDLQGKEYTITLSKSSAGEGIYFVMFISGSTIFAYQTEKLK